mgnify:CR=1 FL=1
MIILVSGDMKTRVALCVNKNIGLKITQFLKNNEDTEICLLYLTGENKTHDSKIIKLSGVKNKNIFRGNEIYKTEKHINFFRKKKIDFLITVYWPWILQESFFQLAKQTINFHPSLLPMNRGWYPHVHNIIRNTRSGVTLHQISKKADEGKIWCQKEVKVNCTDTAKNLYDRLLRNIESLFKSNWNKIKNANGFTDQEYETQAQRRDCRHWSGLWLLLFPDGQAGTRRKGACRRYFPSNARHRQSQGREWES